MTNLSQRLQPAAAPSASVPAGPAALYRNRRHFGSLDGLRAVSILLVLWHHTDRPVAALPMASRGYLGVDIFFVLSGFLIVTLLLREEEATGTISLRRFYARRSLRIFPLYYAILTVMLLGWILRPESQTMTQYTDGMPYYWTYTSNWYRGEGILAISWSLSTEEQFYLLWPPLQRFLGRFALPFLGLFILANQLILFGVVLSEQREQLEILQATFTPIALGVALAFALHLRFDRVNRLVGRRWSAPVFAVVLLLLMNLSYDADPTSVLGWLRLSIHLVIVALVASVVVREDNGLSRLLGVRPLVRLGVVSYGVYLLHLFVRHAVVEGLSVPSGSIALFITMTLATWVLAEASFRLFESPILRLKKRYEVVSTLNPAGI